MNLLQKEPVLLLLNGIAAVVNVVLGTLVAVDVIDWTPAQIASVVASVQAVANLIGGVLRAAVYAPGNVPPAALEIPAEGHA